MPVAFGVTASSAFPVAFPPLSLRNFPKSECDYRPLAWVEDAKHDYAIAPQRWALARTWSEYEDPRREWIHLADGGIADNIGLRIFDESIMADDALDIFENAHDGAMRRFVVIAVDAMPRGEPTADASAHPPWFVSVLNAAATKPMENYSSDTVERVRQFFKKWDGDADDWSSSRERCDDLAAESCGRRDAACRERLRARCRARFGATDADEPPHPSLSRIHVRFDSVPDARVREALQGVPTQLELPREDVEQLIHWGRQLLLESVREQLLEDGEDRP
jgi:NTE family protein